MRKIWKTTRTFVMSIIRGVMRHQTGAHASAISFFVFSAMIPLLFLMILVGSLLVPTGSVQHLTEQLLKSYIPNLPTENTIVPQTIERLGKVTGDVRYISIFGLLWTSVGGFVLLQTILDNIWEIHERRSFFRQYMIGFIMLGVLMSLTATVALVNTVVPILTSVTNNLFSGPLLTLINDAARVTFPIILFVTVFFIYHVLPSHRPRLLSTLTGAFFSTIAIYICRFGFVIYTHHLVSYQAIYGALTFIMLFALWIYVSSIVLLIGVEVTRTMEQFLPRKTSSTEV